MVRTSTSINRRPPADQLRNLRAFEEDQRWVAQVPDARYEGRGREHGGTRGSLLFDEWRWHRRPSPPCVLRGERADLVREASGTLAGASNVSTASQRRSVSGRRIAATDGCVPGEFGITCLTILITPVEGARPWIQA